MLQSLQRKGQALSVSDSVILEFQLVLRSMHMPMSELALTLQSLGQVLQQRAISERTTIDLTLFVTQMELESRYTLTYFDSLIAASALKVDQAIVSSDEAFDKVPSLTRIPLNS